MQDKKYIDSKLRHLKRIGVTADIDPKNGAVRPDWIKHEQEEREKRNLSRTLARQKNHLIGFLSSDI